MGLKVGLVDGFLVGPGVGDVEVGLGVGLVVGAWLAPLMVPRMGRGGGDEWGKGREGAAE